MSSMILISLLLKETVHEHTRNITYSYSFYFQTCQLTVT